MNSCEEPLDELLTTSRAFVGLAVRSIEAAPVDVTVAQHRVLVLLAAYGAQSVGDIAERLGVNPSNASRHCDRLERLRLVARRRSTADGRVVRIELTDAGRGLLEAVTAHRREELRRVLDQMPAADASALTAALRSFNLAARELDEADWADPA